MIPRLLAPHIAQMRGKMPVVAVIGPRQSGKTTLIRSVFPELPYASLEEPETKRIAQEDPRGFLDHLGQTAILDEVQRVPDLLSWLQGRVDHEGCFYVLSGSQNFLLMESVSQSLAGRVAILRLLPFSMEELPSKNKVPLFEIMHRGFFPPILDRQLDPTVWMRDYVATYLERDVRKLRGVRDLTRFHLFLELLAGRVGQPLNHNSLACDVGVSQPTVRDWVALLEASFLIHPLRPFHRNYRKRLVKSPRLYFLDTGLVCSLLGIHSTQVLRSHPLRGPIFENLCVAELLKSAWHRNQAPRLSFWRDRTGHEVDAISERDGAVHAIEFKSGQTLASDAGQGLRWWQENSQGAAESLNLVFGGDSSRSLRELRVWSWRDLPKMVRGWGGK